MCILAYKNPSIRIPDFGVQVSWIGNLLDNLSTAYEKFKDIEGDKIIDNPKLFNLTNYLLTYSEIQKEKESILKKNTKTYPITRIRQERKPKEK